MKPLHGIIPPMVTPFDENERLNESALRSEVRYMIDIAQVNGIVVGGSTGEGHTLELDEIRMVAETACDEAAGRIPVLAGLIVNSTRQAVARVKALADLPLAALQVTPVHYLFRPDDEMMLDHFSRIAEASSIPVMIYNVVPWSYCSPALLTRIIDEVEGVIGVKQSAGDMKLLADLLVQVGDRGLVFSAVDALLYPSYLLGACGSIAALLAAAPTLCVAQWQAVQQGEQAVALELHEKLLAIWNAIEGDNLPANVKTAMALQGRVHSYPRRPMANSSSAQSAMIQQALVAAGLL